MRQLIIDELSRAVWLADQAHPSPIDAQFRFVMPHGHLRLAFPMSDAADTRRDELMLVSDLISLLMCRTFLITREQPEPDVIITTAVDGETTTTASIHKTQDRGRPLFGSSSGPPAWSIGKPARSCPHGSPPSHRNAPRR